LDGAERLHAEEGQTFWRESFLAPKINLAHEFLKQIENTGASSLTTVIVLSTAIS